MERTFRDVADTKKEGNVSLNQRPPSSLPSRCALAGIGRLADGPLAGVPRLPIEGKMDDPGFGRFRAEGVTPLQAAQVIPKANATTEQDRGNRYMKSID